MCVYPPKCSHLSFNCTESFTRCKGCAAAALTWQKPTKKTVPLKHVRKTCSGWTALSTKSQVQINRSLTLSANTTVLIQFHGIRTLHPVTSAVYTDWSSTHTHTHTHIYVLYVKWGLCKALISGTPACRFIITRKAVWERRPPPSSSFPQTLWLAPVVDMYL